MAFTPTDLMKTARKSFIPPKRPVNTTYLKYIAEGRIKAIKVGRGWRTLKTELDRFLRGN
jgi:excisionase family DNA binding protein